MTNAEFPNSWIKNGWCRWRVSRAPQNSCNSSRVWLYSCWVQVEISAGVLIDAPLFWARIVHARDIFEIAQCCRKLVQAAARRFQSVAGFVRWSLNLWCPGAVCPRQAISMRYIGKPLPAAASQRFPGALANQHRAGCDALIAGSEALN